LPFEPVSSSLTIYTVKELDKAPEALLDSTYKSAQEFITQNLVLPEAALKLNLIGYVKLRFVIEPNGLPSNLMVIEPLGGGCTEEAIRIVQLLKWFPGIKNQEAVRTCYNLSFKFDPADEIKSKVIPNQSNTGI
jgi:protein TonB